MVHSIHLKVAGILILEQAHIHYVVVSIPEETGVYIQTEGVCIQTVGVYIPTEAVYIQTEGVCIQTEGVYNQTERVFLQSLALGDTTHLVASN